MATKYERIADDLRAKIGAGDIEPGEKLPAETELAKQYRVSAPTMREAMRVLKLEGLVESQHGRGTYVRKARQPITREHQVRYQWEKDRVRISDEERLSTGATEKDTGLTFDDLEFSAKYSEVKATDQVAKDFKVPVGTKMLQRVYRTSSRHEDAQISLVTSYLVHDVAAKNPALLDETNEPWPGGTQHQLSTIGIEIDNIVDRITTRPPSADWADQLGIDPEGVAVFMLKKISTSTTGAVVEVSYVILPGDRTEFVFTTHLTRWE